MRYAREAFQSGRLYQSLRDRFSCFVADEIQIWVDLLVRRADVALHVVLPGSAAKKSIEIAVPVIGAAASDRRNQLGDFLDSDESRSIALRKLGQHGCLAAAGSGASANIEV
jgi:hypothetical protein